MSYPLDVPIDARRNRLPLGIGEHSPTERRFLCEDATRQVRPAVHGIAIAHLPLGFASQYHGL